MFSLESPHRGDSNKYTERTIIKKKIAEIIPNTIMSAAMGFFLLRTGERVRKTLVNEPSVFEPLKFYFIL